MAERTYRVRIVRGGAEFEAEGDKTFVLDMLKRFHDAADVLPSQGGTKEKPTKSVASQKSLSPGEFIRQFGFKRHTDIVLAFGYYLEHHSGAKDFTPADINNLYYEAKMENSNTSQMCTQNVRKSFMMEAKGKKGEKKRYVLTASGEEYIKKKLSKQPA